MTSGRVSAASAIVGIAASIASGQSVSLHFDADREFAFSGDVVTWTVYASFTGFDDPTAYFGGFIGSAWIEGSDAQVVSFENLMSGEAVPPSFVGGSLENVNIFNNALLGTDDQANPIPIFRVGTEIRTFLATNMDADGTLFMFADNDPLGVPIPVTEFTVTSDVINLPSPGSAWCVVAVVGVTRRRR